MPSFSLILLINSSFSKETVDLENYDSTIGFLSNVGKPVKTSAPIVRLLQDAGAILHAKTTVPTALLSLATSSPVFGNTTNPYNPEYSVGASTGGGAALIACGGSKIEIGSDVGGSVRIPAHFCGTWSLKGSAGRFPAWQNQSSVNGCESIPLIAGPLAGSLEDLEEFWKRVMEMQPWEYDFTVSIVMSAMSDPRILTYGVALVCTPSMAPHQPPRGRKKVEMGYYLGGR